MFPLAIQTKQGLFDILDAIYARNFLRPNHRELVLTLRSRRPAYAGQEPFDRCHLHGIPANPTDISRELQNLGVTDTDIQQIKAHAIRRANEVVTAPEFVAAGGDLDA